ncbi:MAG: PilT/PilU family type 4a pilus ATPase [Sulfuricellaceae bacterium]|nr:PilT/PilU family type 4a pilus ATPase [Sulfuricellaceae bacterium]
MDIVPLLKLMAEKKASDLFCSVGTRVNIKIEGVCRPVNTPELDGEMAKLAAYKLMNAEQIRVFEATNEMNFGYSLPDVGNFRVNVFRQRGNVAMVIRYVSSTIPAIEDLGLPPLLKDMIMEKRGLILVVGATGSGKSTTLASMIDYRNANKTGHILTIEDPIEFVYQHKKSIVNQREVGLDTQSFHNALVNAMREAPDMILIGEIRDRESMQHAMTYAQTGHLCLSTLHANNSYHAMNRIINFFPHEARPSLLLDLSISLKCVISQRLIPGVDGRRVPAVEVLMNTTHIAELIKNGAVDEIKEAMEKSMTPGSQTFEQALYKLYRSGKVSLEQAMQNADSPTNLSWLVNNASPVEEESLSADSLNKKEAADDLSNFTLTFNIDDIPKA